MNQLKFVRTKSTERVKPLGRDTQRLKLINQSGRPSAKSLKSRAQSPTQFNQVHNTDRVSKMIELVDSHLKSNQITPLRKASPVPLTHINEQRWEKKNALLNIYQQTTRKSSPCKQYLMDFLRVMDNGEWNTRSRLPSHQCFTPTDQENLQLTLSPNLYIKNINPLTPNQIDKCQPTLQSINLKGNQKLIEIPQESPNQYIYGSTGKKREIEIMAVPLDYDQTQEQNKSSSYEEMYILDANQLQKLLHKPTPIIELEEESQKQSINIAEDIQYSQLKTDKSEMVMLQQQKSVKDCEIQTSFHQDEIPVMNNHANINNNNNQVLCSQTFSLHQNPRKYSPFNSQNFVTNSTATQQDAGCQTKQKKKQLGFYQYEITFLSPCQKKQNQHQSVKDIITRERQQSSLREVSESSWVSRFNLETPQVNKNQFFMQKLFPHNHDSKSYLLLTQQSDIYKSKEQLLDPPSRPSRDNYDQYLESNIEKMQEQDGMDLISNRNNKNRKSQKMQKAYSTVNNSRVSGKNTSQFSQHLSLLQKRQSEKTKKVDPYFEYKRAVNKSLQQSKLHKHPFK